MLVERIPLRARGEQTRGLRAVAIARPVALGLADGLEEKAVGGKTLGRFFLDIRPILTNPPRKGVGLLWRSRCFVIGR